MMRSRPGIPIPSGGDAEADFQIHQARRTRDELRPKDSSTVKWRQNTHGFSAHANIPAGQGSGLKVKALALKSVEDNYLVCGSFNGTDVGDADVYVAKIHKLRNSIISETIEGTEYDYEYTDGPDDLNILRVASVDEVEIETCIVTPEWLLHDLIYAVPAFTNVTRPATDDEIAAGITEDQPVSLLMLGDGRAWAVHSDP